MKKKGQFLKNYPIAIILFSTIVVGFLVAASGDGGFFDAYDYVPPDNDINTTYNQITAMNSKAIDFQCDINPEAESCPDLNKKPVSGEIGLNFINRMVQGAYGIVVGLLKMFTIPKNLINSALSDIGIPVFFIQAFITMVIMTAVIALMFLIFTRSDQA